MIFSSQYGKNKIFFYKKDMLSVIMIFFLAFMKESKFVQLLNGL